MGEPIVEIVGLDKRYPGVQALDQAALTVLRGEVHGLVGENGAGKSTMIKILAGAERRHRGVIRVGGEEVEIATEHEADELGLHFIHQDVALIPRMTVAENMFLGRKLPRRAGFFVSRRRAVKETRARLEGYVDVDPERKVGSLTIAERWMVAIARACTADPQLVVMDEPTVALSDAEVEHVLSVVRRLREQGIAVLFVSHRLNEVLDIADRVTVMKDGRTVTVLEVKETDKSTLATHIIGVEGGSTNVSPPRLSAAQQPVLEIQGLTSGPVKDVNLSVRPGEILGLGGLVGSGRSSLLLTIFGHHQASSGTVAVDGRMLKLRSPADAIRAGIALVPEDRRDQGLLSRRTVRENIVLAHLDNFRRKPRLPFPDRSSERSATRSEIDRLHIATNSTEQTIATLSGGNQQKCLVSRWLIGKQSKVLLLDEPTKGVDVGAKAEILNLVAQLAATGVAVILASSDLEEVAAVSHRVLVLQEGRIVAELDGPVTEAEVLEHCYATPGAAGPDLRL